MEERVFLADSYVPERHRHINEQPATVFAVSAAPLSFERLPGAIDFCPFTSKCLCDRPHSFPNRLLANEEGDLYYAILHRHKRLNSSSTTTTTTTTSETTTSNSSTSVTSSPEIFGDDMQDLATYKRVWESVLQTERKELLLRYERYSQFEYRMNIAGTVGQQIMVLRLSGIADANPPLSSGDTVIVRPIPRSRLLLPTGFWSSPDHGVEVRSQVHSVQRGTEKDVVVCKWFAEDYQAAAAFLQGFAPRTHVKTNIRFVPSSTPYTRCLTALDWVFQTYTLAGDGGGRGGGRGSRNDLGRGRGLGGGRGSGGGDDGRGGQHSAEILSFLFPIEAPLVPATTLTLDPATTSSQLNHKQLDFLRMVMARTQWPTTGKVRSPMILTGPAGTGKTRTMLLAVKAILDHDPHSRILVCAPSHTAANVITKRLGADLEDSSLLLRLLPVDRPVDTIPVDILSYCHQDDQSGCFTLPTPSRLLQLRVIVCTCSDAYLLYAVGLTNQQLRVQRECYRRHLETQCAAFQLEVKLGRVHQTHFTHLFIDEAAQASEPESLIPLSVVLDTADVRKAEVTLVGDPRQLASTSFTTPTPSLMERLLSRPVRCLGGGNDHLLGEELIAMDDWLRYSLRQNDTELLSVFLTANYRGHPSFLMVPSSLFYSDKLHSMERETNEEDVDNGFWCDQLRLVEALADPVVCKSCCMDDDDVPVEVRYQRQLTWPIHFRGVAGTDTTVSIESGFGTHSWANAKEASVVAEIVEALAANVPSQSIGVMAPFRGQVVQIRKCLRRKGLGSVNVGTVEDYQSVEFQVIVLSLTRSTIDFVEHDIQHRLGLFGQPKRSNVAMTRAEFMFIVVSCLDLQKLNVGSPAEITTRSETPKWSRQILFGDSFCSSAIETDCITENRSRRYQSLFGTQEKSSSHPGLR